MKKRIISLLLSALCVCACFGGCNEPLEAARDKYKFTQGVHDLTAPETNEFMVENGKTEYRILLPETTDQNLIVAESELKYFFEEATGVKLETDSESAEGLTHTADAKYISLGETQMLSSADVDLKEEVLGSQGVRIVTKDKAIYLFGNSSSGTLNAVYTFLNILFEYEQYAYDCYTLQETSNLKLRSFNVVDVPDIEMRACPSTLTSNNPNNLQYRLRTRTWDDYFLSIGDTENGASRHVVHNTSNVIPREAPTSRESWFSNKSGTGGDNTQLCYTTRGNQEDYEALVERAAYVISRSLIDYPRDKYPLKNIVAFTHEDNSSVMCACESCSAAQKKYGAGSGAVLVMANNIRAKLQEWMEQPGNEAYRRDDLKLVFFAYAAYVDAPARYDEAQGKYVITHPDLQMREDVGVFYAISNGLSYQQNLYDDYSKEGVENSRKWFDISTSVYLWTYDANFGNFLFRTAGTNFYDTDAYQFFAQGNAKFLFKQSAMPTANVTSFQMLDIYLDAKMQWDTTQDISELTQSWFKAMFKEAADVMYQLYIQENNLALIIAHETRKIAATGIINYSISKDYWKFEMLRGWLDKIEQARALVLKYETSDPETYTMLKEHIDTEWVCPAYYMLEYNGGSLSDKEYNEMVMYFKTDIAALKDFQFSEKSMTTIGAWAAGLSLR